MGNQNHYETGGRSDTIIYQFGSRSVEQRLISKEKTRLSLLDMLKKAYNNSAFRSSVLAASIVTGCTVVVVGGFGAMALNTPAYQSAELLSEAMSQPVHRFNLVGINPAPASITSMDASAFPDLSKMTKETNASNLTGSTIKGSTVSANNYGMVSLSISPSEKSEWGNNHLDGSESVYNIYVTQADAQRALSAFSSDSVQAVVSRTTNTPAARDYLSPFGGESEDSVQSPTALYITKDSFSFSMGTEGMKNLRESKNDFQTSSSERIELRRAKQGASLPEDVRHQSQAAPR